MKILVCTPEYPPKASGIGNVVKSVVDQLERQGNKCIICSPMGPNIQLGNQVYIEKLGGLGLLFFWEKVRRFFRSNSNNYDVIWLHHPLFIIKNPFNKCLVTMHTTYAGFFKQAKLSGHAWWKCVYYYMMYFIEKHSLTNCVNQNARFTAISTTIAKELYSFGIKSEIAVIPNGTNIEQFIGLRNKNKLREEFKVPKDKIVFIWAGRLIGEKRPDVLINLFSTMGRISDKLFLVVVGNGKLRKPIEKLAEVRQLKNIMFLGALKYSLMPKIYTCGDYYIITSVYEGQPLTLLEALASGLPCIVSDIPNLKMVEDENCGIIVDFSDKEKAAHKIIKYISKDNSEQAENARKYAEENLDWSIITKKYFYEFENLCQLDVES